MRCRRNPNRQPSHRSFLPFYASDAMAFPAFDAYVDLSVIGLYQAWVQLFGWLVWTAVALSVLVAVDRLLQVVGHC